MVWCHAMKNLPRASVKRVIVDVTTASMWIANRRPNWMRAVLCDHRCKVFLGYNDIQIESLVKVLARHHSEDVDIQMGGDLGWNAQNRSRHPVRTVIGSKGVVKKNIEFKGTWLRGDRGDSHDPIHLSLALISWAWGIPKRWELGKSRWAREQEAQRLQSLNRCGDRLERLELELEILDPVECSKNTHTAYYVNAQDHELGTRKILTRILAFAIEARLETLSQAVGCAMEAKKAEANAVLDFPPAAKERRRLIRSLAKDLGLVSESIGD